MHRIYCVHCGRKTHHEVTDDGHLKCDRCGLINYPTSKYERMEWYGDDKVETYCPRCESEEMHDYENGKIRCQSCGLVRSL